MNLAVVIPWFGRDLKGGAEQHAWQLASRLAIRGHSVDVLTTCCRSHQDDWATNHLPEGRTEEPEGFAIRRFAVIERNVAAFDAACSRLLRIHATSLVPGVSPVTACEGEAFVNELIKSPDLLSFIAHYKGDYDRFLFLPYLYGPIIKGVMLTGSKAALIPCLHDESYAYLPQVAEAFYRAGSVLFISEGEQELAVRLFGPGIIPKSTFAGAGVEPIADEPAILDSFAEQLPSKFLLYLGRKDPGKNVPMLVDAFRRFRAVRPNSQLHLVLAGHGAAEGGGCTAILDLGLVTDSEKQRLLERCVALVQPSANESFSRVMLEAWLHEKPVGVHTHCMATSVAVRSANGGWIADDERAWAELCVVIDRTPADQLRRLGENGRRYAESAGDWDHVISRYEAALAVPESKTFEAYSSEPNVSINQFLPNLTYGDAISNEARWIRDELRSQGFRSEIYVRFVDPRVAAECHVFSAQSLQESDAAIYHHSIGSELTKHIVEFTGPKCLIYHNITPPEFFQPYRPEFARILHAGYQQLADLSSEFALSYGDSQFNAEQLQAAGFVDPQVLPICVSPDKWGHSPDPHLMKALSDGATNILFVGRIAPNKKQDDLIRAFSAYKQLDPTARLLLVGGEDQNDPYAAALRALINEYQLESNVQLVGTVTDEKLAAYYRTADLFWSMSEHEGFCVPLVEAMWFDVPILAFNSSAIPETLGDAGLMICVKDDLGACAGLADIVVSDDELRTRMIAAGRLRREEFRPKRIRQRLLNLLDELVPTEIAA